MQYKEFVLSISDKIGGDLERSERTIAAFLSTLGELIPATERGNLAAQLPKELKSAFSTERDSDAFELEEFYNRVSSRAGIGYKDAVQRSQSIASVLKRAVSGGEIEDVLAKLPAEYGELFGLRETGPLSPSK
jgi:uncharacterized protein (DUF2267 family)